MSTTAPTEGAVERTGGSDVTAMLDAVVAELGGSPRTGQQTMAQEIAGAIESGRHLLVQAGTGTGKSLGYLVPAVAHAVAAGEKVLVSTATLALQRQVMTRDLPLVAAALSPLLARPAKVALLKGWQNYACVHKLAGGYPPEDAGTLFSLEAEHPAGPVARDEPESLGEQVVRARAWAEQTSTGDRDDLVPGISERAWRQVAVTSLECLGQKCPLLAECFPERARQDARAADVVVTNHAMLGIAASGSPGVLPEHGVLVVDEAHELADRVTGQATAELSAATIEQAARFARRHGGVATTDLDDAGARVGSLLMGLPEGRFPHGLPEDLRAAVAGVRDAARGLLTELKPGADKDAAVVGGLKVAASAMLVLFEIAERMAADPSGHDVVWSSRGAEGDGRRAGVTRLFIAPLQVAGLVREVLLAERTGIFTSATLNLGGSFEASARSIGLAADGDGTAWRGIDVGTPFDYAKQGILYVARHLPAPGRDGVPEAQLDELAELIEAAGGRTLGLFSSRRGAVAAAEAMRERLDVPILCQGDDQLPTLVEQFAADEATCLFGTLSLWQGVDVPGPACRLVVIDRIPFPRPDDPIRSARTEAVAAAGGNGFMQVSATHAALLLAQGAGRLIRTSQDQGVVAVLDPRLATARYGSYLARSMPPLWPTSDRSVVTGALRRLAH